MVGKAQEVSDPGTKHPGNEIADYDQRYVWSWIWLAVLAFIVFFLILFFLGGAGAIR